MADFLELEHQIGVTTQYNQTLLYHPTQPNTIIYSVASSVVIADLTDPHEQSFLKGHFGNVSSLAVSPSGRFVASGQEGTANGRTVVLIWDFHARALVHQLDAHTGTISSLAFSVDDRFLVSTATDSRVLVWEVELGQHAVSARVEKPPTFARWALTQDDQSKSRNPKYALAIGMENTVKILHLTYDVRILQYSYSEVTCQMPSTGLIRQYPAACVDSSSEYCLAVTSTGELSVFNVPNAVYRVTVPISSGGAHSIARAGDTVFVGCGDGKVKQLVGGDTLWEVTGETTLPGGVQSLCASPDNRHILAVTNTGLMIRLDCQTLAQEHINTNPVLPLREIEFGAKNDVFATLSDDGSISVWDLNTYERRLVTKRIQSKPTCIVFTQAGELITGWEDGYIRCHDDVQGALTWEIHSAHRGAVQSIAQSGNLLISGGDDGIVRVWNQATRRMLQQFQEHSKPVVKVLIDVVNPKLAHSCAQDRTLVSYDLQLEKRTHHYHVINAGHFTSMTQRLDNEQELVTAVSEGSILAWDCDIKDPVQNFQSPDQPSKALSVRVSPSGKYMVSGHEDGSLSIWRVADQALLVVAAAHSSYVSRVTWSPDERQIVSAGHDAAISVWNFFA
eukprot:TRINITY_DN10146_c1_g1_i1.p2 TRINITY_DN10146_c1_g1~~TRINITY_DN10146_c1_g1_i1.p2  ORF type:complete len:619 (+),score=153.59 TRINITY_DN10146_c1_g1_i1:3086-4942(+)